MKNLVSSVPGNEEANGRLFPIWIATANAAIYLMITGVDTFLGNVLVCRPEYWAGYWVLFGACPVFLVTYFIQRRPMSGVRKALLTYFCSSFIGVIVSVVVFHPPLPNWDQFTGWFVFLLPSFLATLVRYYKVPEEHFRSLHIDRQARIAWITHSATLWRILAVSSIVAGAAFIVSWQAYLGEALKTFNATKQEAAVLKQYYTIQNLGCAAYFILGPILECFWKSEEVAKYYQAVEETKPVDHIS